MNNEPVVKPKIRADRFAGSGFICRSKEEATLTARGSYLVLATGVTVEQAYANWKHRRELLQAVTADPATYGLYKDPLFEAQYRRTLNPLARLIRRLTHGKVGQK